MLRPFKKALARQMRAGVVRDGSRAGLACVHRLDDGAFSLKARVVEAEEGDDGWIDRAGAEALQLGRAPVSAVLAANAYQLQLIELPNVPADELPGAVRWIIKDLIDFPIDEAVVEMFEMPRHANAANAPFGYAVVARSAEILRQIDLMQRGDLEMDVIDIPELCMRNIAALMRQDEYGVAFLNFTEDRGFLTVTRNGVLHVIRHIDHGRRALREAADDTLLLQDRIGAISLEVQRSLDYYESHYDCQPIAELILGPGCGLDALEAALAENMGVTVTELALDELFRMETELSREEQGDCLLAAGAALRSELPKQPVVTS